MYSPEAQKSALDSNVKLFTFIRRAEGMFPFKISRFKDTVVRVHKSLAIKVEEITH